MYYATTRPIRIAFTFAVLISYCLTFVHGALDKPTEKELAALTRLRPLVVDTLYQDYMKDDSYLLRWLRHHQLDVNRVADLIKTAHQWRRENKIDSILQEDFSKFEKIFQSDMESVDKAGRPVWIIPFGKWDLRKIALSGQINDYQRYLNYLYEKIEAKIRELDKNDHERDITQFTLLIDMQGYNLRQQGCIACIPGNIHFVGSYERYHAGSAYKTILINTPGVFDSLFDVLQPLMSVSNRMNLEVYGHDQKEWLKSVYGYISRDQLPLRYGGTRSNNIKPAQK